MQCSPIEPEQKTVLGQLIQALGIPYHASHNAMKNTTVTSTFIQ